MHALVFELLNLLVLSRVGQGDAEFASLRTEETSCGDGDATHHVLAGDALDEFGIGIDDVGGGGAEVARPSHVVQEGAFHGEVAHGVSPCVEVEQAVEADGLGRADEGAYGCVGLEAAARADAHHLELAELGLHFARLEVYVGQGVELVHHDVDVVASDAC